MQSNTIEHKVSIFISSKCNGKYTIVRKALEELLLETGMTTVYTFETEPGSSQPMPGAYLQKINDSHLCLFLIDNSDGVPTAVVDEYQRAKELKKKMIFFFCDEYEKNKTELEKEIKEAQIGKCCTVHEFSDLTKLAYESVLQDILDVYKQKQTIPELNSIDDSLSTGTSVISSGNYIIDKNMFSGIDKTKNGLLNIAIPSSKKERNTSELDELSLEFFGVILCKKKFDTNAFEKLCIKIVELHQSHYKELISLRLKAVKYYYEDRIEECVATLKDALQMTSENKAIANWVSNDIAIDLRYINNLSGEIGNYYLRNNEGQEYINNNSEVVFFPVLDRFKNYMCEKIIKQYYKAYTESPYTKTLGGQNEAFKDIAMYYYTALIYGSITHLQLTRSQIIDALSVQCFEYSDHDLFVCLIRFLIVERRDKDLKEIIRIYNQSVDMVNSNDIKMIQECIECIPIKHYKKMSEFLLLKYFGYYFSDAQYSEFSNKLLTFSFDWIDNTNRIVILGEHIFQTFKENLLRLDNDRIVEFIIKVLSMKGNYWYDKAFVLSSEVDYSYVSLKNQSKLLEKSIEILKDEERKSSLNRLTNHLTNFRKTATIDMEILDAAIQENMKDFYDGVYHLEIFVKDQESSIDIIKSYLHSIDVRNEEQGKGGVFSGYSSDPYGVICNIIQYNNLALNWDEIILIIESARNTLIAQKQTYQDKCRAILLIVYLHNHFSYTGKWDDFIDSLIICEEKIFIGSSFVAFKEDTKHVLYLAYQMMLFLFNRSPLEKVINSVISIPNMDDYEILKCLKYIDSILNEWDYDKADDLVITSIIFLASMMANHKECDIRYFAVKCLIQLTHSKYKSIVLHRLSSIMDTSTSVIKASIISRVREIVDGDSSIKNYIIQKGKVDNNYLVKKIANELTKKL